ncbi:coiled-coil domain-containing protein 148 isoform X4 [Varanus komodoensis]|uniref:coiled-coil domain-containing protein 148 isoform X4 n=1 Tax=Varanus komodoensis TaxID=61221 RepID=UPI001CF7E4B0|nr:coiled-coil domain-containing protein 148 isoform X4 [Varanus komodoensis]
MSGKNLQEFNAMHRSSSIDKMVVCVKAGLRSSKYKPVDYEQLHAITEAKKLESANILFKIKKTEYASKFSKEQMLLKQHKQVWWKEHKRLHESRQKLESEMQTFFDEGSECVLDLWDLRYKISEELDTFQANTVQPVWQLREDLRYRLLEMQTNCKCPDYQFNPDAVLKEVEFVKKQQKVLLEKLHIERITLEEELEESTDEVLAYSLEERFALFHEIPSQLLALECPYPDLKASVLTGFHKLAGEYWLKFQEIDQKLQVILSNFQWSKEDLWVYQVVVSQYPSDMQGRRTLYLDMLQKLLPYKSRQNLVAHERAWDHYHFTRNHWRALLFNWAQARKAFLLKAVMTLTEASAAYETEMMLANNRRKQQEICADLKEKVAVVAEFDPARMMADTVSSKARMGIGTEEEFILQKPLFELYTFSAEQIISDTRVRVELALREAGLHRTHYAQELLPKIPPPKLPRKDMESTDFKVCAEQIIIHRNGRFTFASTMK